MSTQENKYQYFFLKLDSEEENLNSSFTFLSVEDGVSTFQLTSMPDIKVHFFKTKARKRLKNIKDIFNRSFQSIDYLVDSLTKDKYKLNLVNFKISENWIYIRCFLLPRAS